MAGREGWRGVESAADVGGAAGGEGRGTWTSVTRSTMAKSAIGAVHRDHTWPTFIEVSADRNELRATHARWGVLYCSTEVH